MAGRPGLAYNANVAAVFEQPPMLSPGPSLIYPQGITSDAPPIVLQLHNAIQTQRATDPQQPVNLQVVTWFLNHQTNRRCLYGREVNLPLDPTRWIPQILSHWNDVWIADEPVEMYLIQPKPSISQWRSGTSFHIMIHQQPDTNERSVLITTFDQTLRVDDPPGVQRAFVVPNVISVLCLLQTTELEQWCTAGADRHCAANYGAINLENHGPFICGHGFHFRITLMNTPPFVWPDFANIDEREDANVFLQIAAILESRSQPANPAKVIFIAWMLTSRCNSHPMRGPPFCAKTMSAFRLWSPFVRKRSRQMAWSYSRAILNVSRLDQWIPSCSPFLYWWIRCSFWWWMERISSGHSGHWDWTRWAIRRWSLFQSWWACNCPKGWDYSHFCSNSLGVPNTANSTHSVPRIV